MSKVNISPIAYPSDDSGVDVSTNSIWIGSSIYLDTVRSPDIPKLVEIAA